jgi:hypothetical protein
MPQFLPRLAHVCASQSHLPVVPQVLGGVQVPQLSVPPQPSGAGPQFLFCIAQLVETVQPQTLTVPPPPHVCGMAQAPQLATLRMAPQLSVPETAPQFLPSLAQNAVSVSGVHPQTLVVPAPPHVCGIAHVPQLMTLRGAPQLSVPETAPQFLPSLAQKAVSLSCVQPQTLVVPPPPHVS